MPSAPLPEAAFGGNGAAAAAAAVAQAQAAVALPELPPVVEQAAPASASPAVSLMSQDDDEAGPEGPQCTQVRGWDALVAACQERMPLAVSCMWPWTHVAWTACTCSPRCSRSCRAC